MSYQFCDWCEEPTEAFNWKYRTKLSGGIERICGNHFKATTYEFVPQSIRDDRERHFNSMVQPYRNGELAKEFVEAYPERTKDMIKNGAITKKDVKNSKHLWKDLKGWSNRSKSK